MVCLLVLVEMFDIVGCDIASPLEIEERSWLLHHDEPSILTGSDYCVVNVGIL